MLKKLEIDHVKQTLGKTAQIKLLEMKKKFEKKYTQDGINSKFDHTGKKDQ